MIVSSLQCSTVFDVCGRAVTQGWSSEHMACPSNEETTADDLIECVAQSGFATMYRALHASILCLGLPRSNTINHGFVIRVLPPASHQVSSAAATT